MFDKNNPLVKAFRHARDLLEKHNGVDISIRIIGATKGDRISTIRILNQAPQNYRDIRFLI
jgi:hypothetical protein